MSSNSSKTSPRTSDNVPQSIPKSRDILDVVRSLKQEIAEPDKPLFGQRVLQKLHLRKEAISQVPPERQRPHSAQVANHMTHDWEPESNPIHRRLPEEHSESWQARRYRSAANADIPDYSREPPGYRRNTIDGYGKREIISKELDQVFLTPVEQEVFHYLSQTGRVAHYKGLVRAQHDVPLKEAVLVHQNDIEPLQKIQAVARRTGEEEKEKIVRNLSPLLEKKRIYTLRLLLFDSDLRITSTSANTGVESPAFAQTPQGRTFQRPERPSSMALLRAGKTGVLDHWSRRESTGYAMRPERDPVRLAMGRQKPATFFSSRPFMVEESSEEDEGEEEPKYHPRLRGGATDDELAALRKSIRLPNRSGRAYVDWVRSGDGPATPQDDERPPTMLWWLAGGRVGNRRKAPTAGELRTRKQAESDNRKQVGFLGTILGVRMPPKKKAEGHADAGVEADDAPEAVMSGGLPAEEATEQADKPAVADEAGGDAAGADAGGAEAVLILGESFGPGTTCTTYRKPDPCIHCRLAMSLFGEEDDAPAARSSQLFDDGPSTPSKNNRSIFADDSTVADDSPWFTPKKTPGRGNLVKSLLADADVPDLYIDTFDSLQSAGYVRREDCQQLLKDSGIRAPDQSKIWGIVGEGPQLGRNEFNVVLALIGLAKEGEELGLDAVDERRNKLPVFSISTKQAKLMAQPQQTPQADVQSGAQAQGGVRKPSFGAGFESDPWGSHKGHKHLNNGLSSGQRTTSNFTTTSAEPADTNGSYGNGQTGTVSSGTGSWGASQSYTATSSTEGFAGPVEGAAGGGFGDEGPGSAVPRRPAQPRPNVGKGAEELITVNLLEEKEGMFMFQHRNYEVASVRRNSKVIRRYSDFVWLLDCLHKRYPFRQLPLLPPKRVAINGNHIAADNTFLEKRRRGLARFANALVRHPVLREEQLVVMFLTVPTELAVWRKQATISVQEEFVGRALPPTLEDSLPQNIQETFDTVRSGVRRSADLYINLCSLVERVCKRKEAIAAEYGRMNLNLVSITETSNYTYAIDVNDVPLLNEGIIGTAKHVATSQALVEDEARAWDEGFVEDLKTMRDSLVGVRDMFDRRDRYAKDNIPSLERRIQQNETKLQGIRAKGDAAKPGEADKVANAITADKQSIVEQHARGVFIKECVRDEILHFQTTQYRVSRLHQDWAQERVKYAELQADNFRAMVDAVDSMPLGD